MSMEKTLGVSKCKMSEFFTDLNAKISLISLSDQEMKNRCDTLSSELGEEFNPSVMRQAAMKPILIIGDPGVGKTCGIVSAIEEHNKTVSASEKWGFKKILLGQTTVGSLQGIPVVNTTTGELLRAQVPDLPDEEKDGKYGILFLDEITTADEAQVQPALGLTDDTRCLGTYTLPEHWLVVAAGNGPNCANFKMLHDMTLSRFACYDVECDYKTDWRPWAHNHGVDPLILAFLNFKPEMLVHVITDADSDDPDIGQMFATPRTWERLSIELKTRKMYGRPVGKAELYPFASRIIGVDASREFSAFAAFQSSIKIDPKAIVNGTASAPTPTTFDNEQQFHIVLQGVISALNALCKADNCTIEIQTSKFATCVGNVLRWFIGLEDIMLDKVINAICELRNEMPVITALCMDMDASAKFFPEFDDFLARHQALILGVDVDTIK